MHCNKHIQLHQHTLSQLWPGELIKAGEKSWTPCQSDVQTFVLYLCCSVSIHMMMPVLVCLDTVGVCVRGPDGCCGV